MADVGTTVAVPPPPPPPQPLRLKARNTPKTARTDLIPNIAFSLVILVAAFTFLLIFTSKQHLQKDYSNTPLSIYDLHQTK
jgi:hypothetical protein